MKKHFLFFFLDDFHRGSFNHLLHFIGFTLLGYGLGKPNLWIVILSPFIMEAGHVYNFMRGTHKEHAIKIIPVQLLAWIVFVGIGFIIARLLNL